MKKLFIADVELEISKFLGTERHIVHLLNIQGNEIGYFVGEGIHTEKIKCTVMTAIATYLANFTCYKEDEAICHNQVIWLIHQPKR